MLKAVEQGKIKLPPSLTQARLVSELNRLGRTPWNVKIFERYAHGRGVATYLAHYLRGGPIGSKRLLTATDSVVRFRYRMPANQTGDRSRQGIMKLPVTEFLGRFLEHVPPRSMQTVRGYGLYSGNQHSQLTLAFEALGTTRPPKEQDALNIQEWLERLGYSTHQNQCPVCGRELVISERYYPSRLARSPPAGVNLSHAETSLQA